MQDVLTAAEIANDLVNEESYGATALGLRIQKLMERTSYAQTSLGVDGKASAKRHTVIRPRSRSGGRSV